MRQEDTLILSLLNNNSEDISYILHNREFQWQTFFKIIKYHRIEPLILQRLQKIQLSISDKKIITKKYKQVIISTMEDHTILKKEWLKVRSLLSEAHIECILLKGLSLDTAYTRSIGDLDILIRKKDLAQATALLIQNGYENITSATQAFLNDAERKNSLSSAYWNNEFQFYNKKNRLLLELHINIFQNKRIFAEDLSLFLKNIDTFWLEKRSCEECNGYVLSKENLLLLFCLHSAIKRAPGRNSFLLRNIFDIHNLIQKQPRWEMIIERAFSLKIIPFVYFSLKLTRKLLKSHIPSHILRSLRNGCRRSELFLIRIHLRCLKNFTRSSLLYTFIYRVINPFIFSKGLLQKLRWSFYLPIIAPPKYKIARQFNLKLDSPFIYICYLLNPIRLLYSAIYYIFRKIM